MPNALLTIRDLKKSYLISAPLFRKSIGSRSKQALAGVSLTLGPGLYGLLGPNGAGKSTLISIITDTLAADSGEVLWCGKPARGIRFRRVLGYMPQQQGLYDSYTGRRFLAYMAALKELPRKSVPAEVDRVAAAVNLSSVRLLRRHEAAAVTGVCLTGRPQVADSGRTYRRTGPQGEGAAAHTVGRNGH